MKLALLVASLAALGLPIAQSTNGGGFDVTSAVLAYGVAAPFALLCFVQLTRAQKKIDDLEGRVERMQQEALNREKEFAGRLAPLLFDGAQLYKAGNERLTRATPPVEQDVHELAERVEDLLRRLGEGEGR